MDDLKRKEIVAGLRQKLTDAEESYRALTAEYHRQRKQFAQAVDDNLKRKEIVDFALTERIESLIRQCDDHAHRNSDLTRRFGLQETRITDLEKRLVNKALRQEEDRVADLEKRLVNKARDHVICTKERNTLRAKVAELESAEEEFRTRLAAVTEDRDQLHRITCARAKTINAARDALKS